jgi:disease resistance protein RPM1
VEFIKDEMMNMNGFLLDLADVERPSHRADAWAKQVKELAYDSQNCIDHYMQCTDVPGSRSGLLATARRTPRMLRTMLARHHIAKRIKELKARASDLG